MKQIATLSRRNSSKEIVGLGVLWLALGLVILVYPIIKPVADVRWETATELETAGFNLYRGTSSSEISQLINRDGIIPSAGQGLSGAAYSFADNTVKAGHIYYYLIEEIEFNGSANPHTNDIFTYSVPYATLFSVIPAAISIIIGLIFIVTGIKGKRTI